MKKTIILALLAGLLFLAPLYSQSYYQSYRYGDVDADHNPSIVDALKVAQYAAGINPELDNLPMADVNFDYSVNIVDALLIARFSAGLIQFFPAESYYVQKQEELNAARALWEQAGMDYYEFGMKRYHFLPDNGIHYVIQVKDGQVISAVPEENNLPPNFIAPADSLPTMDNFFSQAQSVINGRGELAFTTDPVYGNFISLSMDPIPILMDDESSTQIDNFHPLREVSPVPLQYNSEGFTLESIEIVGDLLVYEVTYGDSCKEHKFEAYIESFDILTDEIVATLMIRQEKMEDGYCLESATKKMASGLMDLKEYCISTYGTAKPLSIYIPQAGPYGQVSQLVLEYNLQ